MQHKWLLLSYCINDLLTISAQMTFWLHGAEITYLLEEIWMDSTVPNTVPKNLMDDTITASIPCLHPAKHHDCILYKKILQTKHPLTASRTSGLWTLLNAAQNIFLAASLNKYAAQKHPYCMLYDLLTLCCTTADCSNTGLLTAALL